MKKILFIFGTRPEAIKMAPLIKVMQENGADFQVKICVTGQHREMLDQVLSFFEIIPDFDLNLMQKNQTLFDITSNGLKGIEDVFNKYLPDVVFVQGDTTTAFIGALAAFYKRVKVAHLEAGLRSHNKFSPYPEEVNRILAGNIADYHFAPTERALNNLKQERINADMWIVGNTVIDALLLGLKIIEEKDADKYQEFFNFIDFSKRIVMVTGHRRESFGEPFENICNALNELTEKFDDIEIVYPVHLNPNVRDVVNRILKDKDRIHLIEPLDYPYLIWLMNKSYIILTDSGGIQEEAPSLGKPVLVMREVTERTEGIEAGNAELVGTNKEVILNAATRLLTDAQAYEKMANAKNPYGDGTTSVQIADILKKI